MLSFADFKTCVDKLPLETRVSFAAFGEPQLNPAFVDMVLYTHSTGRSMELYSTLLGMTKESYEKIRGIPFKWTVLHIPDRDGNSHFELSEQYLELLDLVLSDVAAGRFKVMGYSCHGEVHPVPAEIFKKNGLPVPITDFTNLHDRAGAVKDPSVKHRVYTGGSIWCLTRDGILIVMYCCPTGRCAFAVWTLGCSIS